MGKRRTYHNGKRVSKGEKQVSLILEKYNIIYNAEQTFLGCVSKKGKPLRFDFFIPDQNLCIEYQGQHHYAPINKYQRAKITHNLTKLHDGVKKQFLQDNSIELLEIAYWDYKKIEHILFNCLYM